ncbi:unnamed protein product [Gordionus sp. m RMFG-2023]|uniref:enoyl-[acyl-carrier-protein] reductase, mitochondrial-like n=1 Tax=Gordionus sp. m RMFG-2023 TaxID=3053472 RepID=UPI0030E14C35
MIFKFKKCKLSYFLRSYNNGFSCKWLEYDKYGDPLTILELKSHDYSSDDINKEIIEKNILVKILASPINPADINKINGTYGYKSKGFPTIAGTEGVAQVINTYNDCDLKKGDKVIFIGDHYMGTWREFGFFKREHLYKIPAIHTMAAAMLLVNPCTAYSLLKKFIHLTPGDVIIQNGANSGVGQFVIQLAHIFGINTINIVRNRENIDQLIGNLQMLGANCVFTDDSLKSDTVKNVINKVGLPKLALNCVGGQNCLDMISHLQKDATLITYGGMSKKPVIIPTKYFIFNNLKALGFMLNHDKSTITHEITELCSYFNNNYLSLPSYKTFKLNEYKDAIHHSQTPYNTSKSMFVN